MKDHELIEYWKNMLNEAMEDKTTQKIGIDDYLKKRFNQDSQKIQDIEDQIEKLISEASPGVLAEFDDVNEMDIWYTAYGRWVSNGIGAYEYWGQKCYDHGTYEVEFEDVDLNINKIDEVTERIGINVDIDELKLDNDEIEWNDENENTSGRGRIECPVMIVDLAKFEDFIQSFEK